MTNKTMADSDHFSPSPDFIQNLVSIQILEGESEKKKRYRMMLQE